MRRMLAGLVACACLGWAAPARADAVSDWNAIAALYITTGRTTPPVIPVGRPGPPGLLDFALVHTAIHDAVQAIQGRFQPYHYSDASQLGVGSVDAAVAGAAYGVLRRLYPGQQASLAELYDDYLTTHGLAGDPALEVGEAAALALHTNHYRPTLPVEPFFGNDAPGQWRSTVPMAALFLAFSEPYTLNRPSQFRPPPPPPLSSDQYAREYAEVQLVGRNLSHPGPHTDIARFWSVNFFAQWNEVLRQLADAHLNDVGDSARLFALANLTAADTAIAVWDSKYHYNFWRPDMAIQNGDDDRNAKTVGVPGWTPFLANPAYPDWVSGANGATAAFTGTMQLFFGTDDMNFSVRTTHPLVVPPERFFTRFSQAQEEVVDARVFLGIHFRSADEEARRLGNRVAHWVFQRYLRPVPGAPR